jgi:hypothetical protein
VLGGKRHKTTSCTHHCSNNHASLCPRSLHRASCCSVRGSMPRRATTGLSGFPRRMQRARPVVQQRNSLLWTLGVRLEWLQQGMSYICSDSHGRRAERNAGMQLRSHHQTRSKLEGGYGGRFRSRLCGPYNMPLGGAVVASNPREIVVFRVALFSSCQSKLYKLLRVVMSA